MKTKRAKAIGVFDSGFGGLAILKEIVKALPKNHYVYLGDNARSPYGARSMETVYRFSTQAVDFLFAHDCELIIFACNTASADALRKIQQEYLPKKYPGKHTLGVIVPALEEAVERTKNNRIGVLATEGSVASGAFPRELHKMNSEIKTFQQAAPLLVPLIEAGEHRSKAAQLILQSYLVPLLRKNIDTLILGCTHYGHLEHKIKRMVGKRVEVISEGSVVARKLADYLKRHPEIESRLSHRPKVDFYSTDLSERFQKLGALFFGKPIRVQKIELE